MEWEKVAVPFKVSVDVHSVVESSLKKQLRNLSQYTWVSWDDAATYLLAEKTDYEEPSFIRISRSRTKIALK